MVTRLSHSRARASAFILAVAVGAVVGTGAWAQAPVPLLPANVDGITIYGQVGQLVGGSEFTNDSFFLGTNTGMRGAGVEFAFRADPGSSMRKFDVELGFGYEYETGFVAKTPNLEAHGAVLTIPSVTAYLSPKEPVHGLTPYLGLRTGYVQLSNVRLFNGLDQQFAIDGSTFQFGVALGIWHETGWLLEVSAVGREVRSLDWKLPAGTSSLPSGAPRSANLSEVTVALGYQVFRAPAATPKPAK